MTPHDIIYDALERRLGMYSAEILVDEILERLAGQGFVVVQADRVIQQAGKVSVTRELVESVLEDAETLVTREYVINDEIYPADRDHYVRDMADIVALRAELQGDSDA